MNLEVCHLKKHYAGQTVLEDFSLTLPSEGVTALCGPSGCGKTTTLRTITGFIEPVEGAVVVKDRDITHVPIEDRNIGIVFQSYALFPTMTVYDNIAFGLKVKKAKKDEIDRKVREIARKVDLSDEQLKKAVSQLSGGQQQRVALARTLTQSPLIILADEPVAALDPVTAKQVMQDFVHINQEMGISILLNIHHVELALEYADRIIGIRAGKIVYDGPSARVDQAVLDSIYGEQAGAEECV